MIIQFMDRKEEKAELKNILSSDKFELFILYGRRRIGKTELVLNATKKMKRIYFLASGDNNLSRFYDKCMDFDKRISDLKMDWEVLFEHLKDKAEVIILDEFQNMFFENKNILNTLQIIVDDVLKNSKMKVILLGSSVSIMTSKVLSYQSPLYGRRTGSMELKAVSFFDLPEFFPEYNTEELMNIFSFADGIPFYLARIDNRFWKYIKTEIQKNSSFIKDEIDFLLRYEFSDPGTYKLILEAIAKGSTKLEEIKNAMKFKRTDISPYIKNLIGVGIIRRNIPITENIKSRMGRYEISDNFIKFWFRYIYPNISSIEEGIFDTDLIRKDYPDYQGKIFEDVCRQFLIKKSPFEFTKIGKWWYKDNEIDIIAMNEINDRIYFIECKWKKNVNWKETYHKLKEKSKNVSWKNDTRKENYVIIAKSFKNKEKTKECLLFDIQDFF